MHETEEEQIEALKKWWEENSKSVVIGLLIGVGAIVGFNYWTDYRVASAEEASALYVQLVDAVKVEDMVNAQQLGATLTGDYASTPYAHLAAFLLAKAHAEAGMLEKAIADLQPVVAQARGEMQHIARVRLARLLRDHGQLDQALALVQTENQGAFAGMYSEVLGDIYAAKAMKEKAMFAYQQALVAGAIKEDWVQMKLNALGALTQSQ